MGVNSKLILIVGDETEFRKKVISIVESLNKNIKVLEADNCTAAQNILDTFRINLIIIDVEMQVNNVIELLHEVNLRYKFEIPAVAVSRYEKHMKNLASMMLVKPENCLLTKFVNEKIGDAVINNLGM